MLLSKALFGGKENGQYKGSNRFHFLSKPSRETPPTDNNSASNMVSVRQIREAAGDSHQSESNLPFFCNQDN